jgi:Holliday junction DNA helicase RuvA
VGYDVAVPLSTYYTAGDTGAEIALRVHTHVREDQLSLYGFASPLELALFERLIGVSGIGPKLALAVLSGIEPRELVAAIQRGDVVRLTRIPGVGTKTAERISMELRDRLPKALESVAGEPLAGTEDDERRADLASALGNLGYDQRAVDKALETVMQDAAAEASFELHLRAALKILSRT